MNTRQIFSPRLSLKLIFVTAWSLLSTSVYSDDLHFYEGTFSHADLGVMNVKMSLDKSLDDQQECSGELTFLTLRKGDQSKIINLTQKVQLTILGGKWVLQFGKMTSSSVDAAAQPYPSQTKISLTQQGSQLTGMYGKMRIQFQSIEADSPDDDSFVWTSVDNSQSWQFLRKIEEIMAFHLAGERVISPKYNEGAQNSNLQVAATYALANSKLSSEVEKRYLALDTTGIHPRVKMLYDDHVFQAQHSARSWKAVADAMINQLPREVIEQRIAEANLLVTTKASRRAGVYRALLNALLPSGSNLGSVPPSEATPDESLVKDSKSLAYFRDYQKLVFGPDNKIAVQFTDLWMAGQDMLKSQNLDDVSPSAAQLQKANDFRAEIIKSLEEHPWDSAGVHPWVVMYVNYAIELMKRRHEIAERIIEARYQFAANPTDANIQRHNQISDEMGVTDREDHAVAGFIGTCIEMFEHGMVLGPYDKIMEAAKAPDYIDERLPQAQADFRLEEFVQPVTIKRPRRSR
ncbi:hypothetical protein [Thalassoglobus polymorphus]|uniref:Uncharacterized protein n=1 Tax=Thalassoglobus polymorphus TaxID=2527994 RepID=A0A517QL96_9PLAN|nr:hypothetical protein [Thalassoglobus polymorphus]QDT32307.1 hypothetical protein Mal48_15500 [Thalassoglobus polymorphus]